MLEPTEAIRWSRAIFPALHGRIVAFEIRIKTTTWRCEDGAFRGEGISARLRLKKDRTLLVSIVVTECRECEDIQDMSKSRHDPVHQHHDKAAELNCPVDKTSLVNDVGQKRSEEDGQLLNHSIHKPFLGDIAVLPCIVFPPELTVESNCDAYRAEA